MLNIFFKNKVQPIIFNIRGQTTLYHNWLEKIEKINKWWGDAYLAPEGTGVHVLYL